MSTNSSIDSNSETPPPGDNAAVTGPSYIYLKFFFFNAVDEDTQGGGVNNTPPEIGTIGTIGHHPYIQSPSSRGLDAARGRARTLQWRTLAPPCGRDES